MRRPKSAWAVLDHRLRRAGLQVVRLAGWRLAPARWPAPRRASAGLDVLVHALVVPLRRDDPHADPALEAGKVRNVALAAPAFDGLEVTPERPLSFWRALGRPSAGRGFSWGMELRGGCVVPAIAGGLCLLSNALFELAVRAGWRIHERHGHSLEAIPPAPGALHLDATVAWPDVDLVVAPVHGPARLAVCVRGDELVVEAFAARASDERIALSHDERVEDRGADRVRRSRVERRRLAADGRVLAVEEVARSERRILAPDELGRTCVGCGEHDCRDRPDEAVLVTLRATHRR